MLKTEKDMQQYLNKTINPFQEGQEAWNGYYKSCWKMKPENPYKKDTENWRLWNRGWNTNFKGIK
jgi:hypothetical protein